MAGRSLRNQVFICDLSYHPGVPLWTAPPTTPECEPHTPHPKGYVAHSDWADLMMKTHDQRQCKGCGLWMIWETRVIGTPTPGSERESGA